MMDDDDDRALVVHLLQTVSSAVQPQNTRRGRSRGGSFIPGNGKKWGSGHFLETHVVKQHHLNDIPHIDY